MFTVYPMEYFNRRLQNRTATRRQQVWRWERAERMPAEIETIRICECGHERRTKDAEGVQKTQPLVAEIAAKKRYMREIHV
jgi:hypothetical protein